MDGKEIIKYYPHEHYTSIFNSGNGLSLRIEDGGFDEPFWASHGPELLDISITNYCTKGCNICYRNSHKNGKHILLSDLEIILKQAKELDVRQIALGGGNPNQHPDFLAILDLISQKYGIVPSYTTNGNGVTDDIIKATKENCGVVAVSISKFDKGNYGIIEKLIESNVKTNIHFVITSETIDEAIAALKNKKSIPNDLNAIVFLSYKPVGNHKSEKLQVFFFR
jgi:MoaA/NifB/PqqE/SkfB family radical SAM enzyme